MVSINGKHAQSTINAINFGDNAANSEVMLFVPSTSNVNIPISPDVHSFIVDYVAREFSALYGGASVKYIDGYYIADNGDLVRENVAVVSSLAFLDNSDNARASISRVYDIACLLKTLLKQESVLIQFMPVQAAFFV